MEVDSVLPTDPAAPSNAPPTLGDQERRRLQRSAAEEGPPTPGREPRRRARTASVGGSGTARRVRWWQTTDVADRGAEANSSVSRIVGRGAIGRPWAGVGCRLARCKVRCGCCARVRAASGTSTLCRRWHGRCGIGATTCVGRSPPMVASCRGDGVRVVPRRPDDTARYTGRDGAGRAHGAPDEQRRGPLFAAVFARAAGPAMRDDLEPIFDQVHPNVVVRETAELAAAPMAAARDIRSSPWPSAACCPNSPATKCSATCGRCGRPKVSTIRHGPTSTGSCICTRSPTRSAASRLAARAAGPPRSGRTECHTAWLGGGARHRSAVRVRDGGNRTAIGHVPWRECSRRWAVSTWTRSPRSGPTSTRRPRDRTGQRPCGTVRPAG